MKRYVQAAVLTIGVLAATAVLSGCSGAEGEGNGPTTTRVTQAQIDKAMNTPTTITFWTWMPDINREIEIFEKKYPKITVKALNVGQSLPHYIKLTNAISAGQGEPDVAHIEYAHLPQFELTNSLLNLAPYGAKSLKDSFTTATWGSVTRGNAVYGVPQDTGPMGNLYRQDIFAKAGFTSPPKTWDEFAQEAAVIKSKTGSMVANLAPNDAEAFIGLLWQAGVKPFSYSGGKNVKIDLNSAKAKEVTNYWNKLISDGLVGVDADYTTQWYQGLASGKYASWQVAAWGGQHLQGQAKNTASLWRAAPLPQYSSAAEATGLWGGSSTAVMKSTKHPIVAYEFAKFLNTDPASVTAFNQTPSQQLFPAQTEMLKSSSFNDATSDFFGGQKVNQQFAQIAETAVEGFEWPPFMNFVDSSFNNTLGKAIADKTDLTAGLNEWQQAIVTYAKSQGFDVSQ